jgi:hypothetical protein
MAKNYMGKVPSGEDGWCELGEVEDDGVTWGVFVKKQAHTEDWVTLKVAAKGRAYRKANYWLVKNFKTGQIGFCRDFATMRQHRPELHQKVEAVFDAEIFDFVD